MEQKQRGFGKGVALGVAISAIVVAALVWFAMIVLEVSDVRLVAGDSSSSKGSYTSELLSDDALKKLDKIIKIVDQQYLYEVDEDALLDGIYKGLMNALGDPYSAYYTVDEFSTMSEESEGIYVGIGVQVQQDVDTGYIKVIRVFKNSPAEEAGLRTNDYIVAADDVDFFNMDINVAVTYIRGEENSTVHVKWLRDGEYMEADMERRTVETETVVYEMLEGGMGYVQLMEFDEITVKQMEEALGALQNQGMKGLILDLRDNPGGLLDAVTEISDMLAPKGVVTNIKDKNGNEDTYRTGDNDYLNIPLVVLVNGNSASASEILTGVVRDYELGTIVGTKTFGKGIVQSVFSLGDGSAMKVTMADYYTPNGENIHGVGIEPDVIVEQNEDTEADEQLNEAVYILKSKMQ